MTLHELRTTEYPIAEFKAFETRLRTDRAFKACISETYRKLFDRVLGSCVSSHWDMYFTLKKMDMKDVEEKLKSKFRLRAGDIIKSWNGIQTVGNANLTDELALAHLRDNPACRAQFIEVPENLDELLAEKPKKAKTEKAPEAPEVKE